MAYLSKYQGIPSGIKSGALLVSQTKVGILSESIAFN